MVDLGNQNNAKSLQRALPRRPGLFSGSVAIAVMQVRVDTRSSPRRTQISQALKLTELTLYIGDKDAKGKACLFSCSALH